MLTARLDSSLIQLLHAFMETNDYHKRQPDQRNIKSLFRSSES
jgi:hypothetical protein